MGFRIQDGFTVWGLRLRVFSFVLLFGCRGRSLHTAVLGLCFRVQDLKFRSGFITPTDSGFRLFWEFNASGFGVL